VNHHLTLTLLEGQFAICQLAPHQDIPPWATRGEVWSVTRTPTELTVVCGEHYVPKDAPADGGWGCLRIDGHFDLSMTGVLDSVAGPLANAGVSIFAFSTFETDYLLIRSTQIHVARATLTDAGHAVHIPERNPR